MRKDYWMILFSKEFVRIVLIDRRSLVEIACKVDDIWLRLVNEKLIGIG